MKLIATLTLFAAVFGLACAEDKKAPDFPDMKSKEWKDVKDGDGVKFWDVKEGKGDAVTVDSTVKVHYTVWSTEGKLFESSIPKNEPIEYPLKKLIKGWQIGVPGMKPGGVRRLTIPWKHAYGEKGTSDGSIPGKTDLVFEFELLGAK
jgi:FKBP-type peptidyl-prolyl cis-trans isomerase